MLAQWGALTDPSPGNSAKAKRVVGESNEAREGRLRSAYENALELCNSGKANEAKQALLKISEDLSRETVGESSKSYTKRHLPLSSSRPTKRSCIVNEVPWVQSLRYAVNRNLADVFMSDGDASGALRTYSLALEDDDSDFVIWMRAARAACAIGHLHVARRAYEAAMRMRPGHWLCQDNYFAVLQAIGDQDEDIEHSDSLFRDNQVGHATIQLLNNRYKSLESETRNLRDKNTFVQEVKIAEARWMCVVDALGSNLANRLGRGKECSGLSVGSPIKVFVEGYTEGEEEIEITPGANPMVSSEPRPMDEVHDQSNIETQHDKDEAKVVNPATDSKQSCTNDNAPVLEKEEKTTSKKQIPVVQPADPRRSLRQRGMEEPIIQQAEEISDEFLDSMFHFSQMAANQNFDFLSLAPKSLCQASDSPTKTNATEVESMKVRTQDTANGWGCIISERQELQEVFSFCKDLNMENSGPFDALMRILSLLAQKESSQFTSELAQSWILLRKYGTISMPGNVRASACLIEALLVSGSKVKRTKLKKYGEATRLLAMVSATYGERFDNDLDLSSAREADDLMLRLRFAWLYCHINEKNSSHREAFEHASRGLQLARKIAATGVTIMAKICGPELAEMKTSEVISLLEACFKRLKRASELQKATKELECTKDGDQTSASKALAILAPSIRESVQLLGLNKWKKGEAEEVAQSKLGIKKARGEQSTYVSEGEELEKRLKVFGEACTKIKDSIGEVLCASIRLRLAIVSYWVRTGKERTETIKRRGGTDDSNSAAGKLAEALTDIRHYVMNVRTMASALTNTSSSSTLDKSGWSLTDAVEIAIHTLISLAELLCKMIPTVRNSQVNGTHLSGAQKNQRLAFTRCILAFCRCLDLRMKLNNTQKAADDSRQKLDFVSSSRMLSITSFCLRILADRGCCRGEGTAGALIKMYTNQLTKRLQLMVRPKNEPHCMNLSAKPQESNVIEIIVLSDDLPEASVQAVVKEHPIFSPSYSWEDINIVRQQLAQCYHCLYRLSDLETPKFKSADAVLLRWLEDGCQASKQLGLRFVTGDPNPSTPKMNAELCRNVFFLYRKQFLMHSASHQRDRARTKASRDAIHEIVATLPEDPPEDVPALSFAKLDAVVSAAVEDHAPREQACTKSVAQMRKDWEAAKTTCLDKGPGSLSDAQKIQVSTLYFEAHVLNTIATLAAYESEFKKNKNVARRKGPKEVVERLFTASTDCVTALRCRPWSIGAWILLGRIFVELADVALDEREMALSTFGCFQPEDLASVDGGESAEGINRRAEVCFGFAEVLIKSAWSRDECSFKPDIPAAEVYSEAQEHADDADWCGFGDDGDLFGGYGLCNKTTSRPWLADEDHPHNELQPENSRLRAAVHFGRSALFALRSREDRYWYSHWNLSAFQQSDLSLKVRPIPSQVANSLNAEYENLEKGMQLVYLDKMGNEKVSNDTEDIQMSTSECTSGVKWRIDLYVFDRQKWYYLLRRAKLKRKLGFPAKVYILDFASAIIENTRLRAANKLPPDIEPLYQLHAVRAKLLFDVNTGFDHEILKILLQHSFNQELVKSQNELFNGAQTLEHIRRLIGGDILNAMKRFGTKSDQAYTEFYFKSGFYRTILYRDLFGEKKKALGEISQFFRGEHAAKAIKLNSDGVHRGYFYLMWNYRHTDTGSEMSLEPERKFVRWRFKLLGLYTRLLREAGDRKTIAGIVSRLKRRSPDDLPVDGSLLDDLILGYSEITRQEILNNPPSVNTVQLSLQHCELSFRQTWDVFVETLRLVQGMRRLKSFMDRNEPAGVNPLRLIESKRPWCEVAIANTLHLERLRWLTISTNVEFDVEAAIALPYEGTPELCTNIALGKYADTMQDCGERWKIDAKLDKLLKRRVDKYKKMQTCADSPSTMKRAVNGNVSSTANTPARPHDAL